MPEWEQRFAFAVGDRVKVMIPLEVKTTDAQWAKYDGRYGTVGRIHFETRDGLELEQEFLRYRIDLESAPRGKGHILWCRENYLARARGGKNAQE